MEEISTSSVSRETSSNDEKVTSPHREYFRVDNVASSVSSSEIETSWQDRGQSEGFLLEKSWKELEKHFSVQISNEDFRNGYVRTRNPDPCYLGYVPKKGHESPYLCVMAIVPSPDVRLSVAAFQIPPSPRQRLALFLNILLFTAFGAGAILGISKLSQIN